MKPLKREGSSPRSRAQSGLTLRRSVSGIQYKGGDNHSRFNYLRRQLTKDLATEFSQLEGVHLGDSPAPSVAPFGFRTMPPSAMDTRSATR